MTRELRCDSKKHAVLIEEAASGGVLEVKCDSRFCGAQAGVVVLHRFDLRDGSLIDTHRYKTRSK